jgi:SET domain-containing protein 6
LVVGNAELPCILSSTFGGLAALSKKVIIRLFLCAHFATHHPYRHTTVGQYFDHGRRNLHGGDSRLCQLASYQRHDCLREDRFSRYAESRRWKRCWYDTHTTDLTKETELTTITVARENIAEDETLFSIPRSTILTTETSSIPKTISSELQDPWLSLILTMLYEHQQAQASKWAPYFDVLPAEFDTLMFWSEAELKDLKGSAVVNKIGKASADATFEEQILPLVYQNVQAFNAQNLSNDQLLALCHRMGSTIMSYAFDLETAGGASDEEEWEVDSEDGSGPVLPKGMVPLADMLNANADLNNAKLFHEDDAVVMRSIKPIAAGEQIYNDYGSLPRADVLRRYGYVTEEYAKYDVVELSDELISQTAKEQLRLPDADLSARLAYLEEQGVLDSGYDVARASSEEGAFPEELCVLLNTLTTPAPEFEKMQKKDKLPKTDLSTASSELLYTILLRRRAEYGSIDTDSLRAQVTDSNNSRRRAMALQVVTGESEVLNEAAAKVQETLGGNKKRRADTFEEEAQQITGKRMKN